MSESVQRLTGEAAGLGKAVVQVCQHGVQHDQTRRQARAARAMMSDGDELSPQRGASGAKQNSAQQETARVD